MVENPEASEKILVVYLAIPEDYNALFEQICTICQQRLAPCKVFRYQKKSESTVENASVIMADASDVFVVLDGFDEGLSIGGDVPIEILSTRDVPESGAELPRIKLLRLVHSLRKRRQSSPREMVKVTFTYSTNPNMPSTISFK